MTTVRLLLFLIVLLVVHVSNVTSLSVHLKDGEDINDRMKSYRYDLLDQPPSTDHRAALSLLNLSAISPEIFVSAEMCGECANDTQLLYDGIRNYHPWALEMLDASAKIPSRVLKGNLNWWGSYSECINVQVPPLAAGSGRNSPENQIFLGQYCSVKLNINITTSDDNELTSSNAIKDILDSMTMHVPRKDRIPDLVVGVCVPSSCSPAEVKSTVENAFRHILDPKSIVILANVQSCQTKNSAKLDTAAISVLTIFGVFALLIVIATVYEIVDGAVKRHKMTSRKHLHESRNVLGASTEIQGTDDSERRSGQTAGNMLLCFSALTNARQLFAVAPKKSGNLRVLDGMRFLSMAWIITVHSYSLAIVNGGLWDNMGDILNATRFVLFQAIIRGATGVDTFLFMSGLLLVYAGMKKVKDSSNSLRCLGHLYLHRVIRTAPAYFMTVAWVSGPSDYVAGGGPLWPQIVQGKQDCQQTWWKSLLYIGNFGDTLHMCAPHTWYMAMDMQFYIVGCVLLIILQRFRNVGLFLIALCGVASCVTAGVISYLENIPSSPLLWNVPQLQLIAYSKDYYIKPYCRMGPYAVGMIVGYLILCGGDLKTGIKPVVAYGLWILTAVVNLFVVYGTYGQFTSAEEPNVLAGTMYNALAGTAWSLGIAWIVYACHVGYGGFIKTLLSLNVWVPLSHMTYSAYLVHYIVIYTFYDTRQDEKFHFDAFLMVTLFLGFLMLSYGVAFLFAMAFESPFVKLERILTAIKKKQQVNPADGDRNFNTLNA